jgi:beta-phosphoglucomutase-like phosphatase (HAD superfamily)
MPFIPKAVVFDFDGLILDTETPEVSAWDEEFARRGLRIPDGWWEGLTGRGPDEVLEWPIDLLRKMTSDPLDEVDILARINKSRLAGIASAPIRPGVVQLLDQAATLGLHVGIASSSKHEWVEGHLERKELLHRFPIIACHWPTSDSRA